MSVFVCGWPWRATLRAWSVGLLLGTGGPARAQQAEEAAPGEDGRQAGETAPVVDQDPLSEVIDVVGRVPDPVPMDEASQRDPTSVVTVIDVKEFGGRARDTAEVLATSPGVAIQDTGGHGQSKSLMVRGASSNGTLVLLDGIPLNGAGGIVDLSRVPLVLASRFEVLRGSAGARYGAGGLGGVVNIITPAPGEAPRVAGELTYGSWNTTVGWLSATGPVLGSDALLLIHGGASNGRFSYPFDATPTLPGDALQERQRDNNDAHGGGALLRVRRRLAPGVLVDLLGEASLNERGLAGTAQNPIHDGRQADRRGAVGLRLLGSRAGGVRYSARVYYRHERLALSGGPVSQQGVQVQRVGGAELEGRMPLGGWNVVSLFAGVGGEGVSLGTVPPGREPRPTWFRASVMAMDEVVLANRRLILAPSFRLERAGPYTLASPKLGAALLLPWGLEVRANAGQTYRPPSMTELYVRQGTLLPNADLRPERALSADLAVQLRTRRALLSAGGFYSHYKDLIAYEAYPPFAAKPYNFAAARVVGIEASAEARPLPWLAGALDYTLLVSRNLRDDPRYYLRELPLRPRHTVTGRVSAGPPWLEGRVELRTQSSQLRNRTGESTLPARTLLHAGVSSTLGSRPLFKLGVEFKNLLDTHTEDFDGYPLPGRAVYASVAVSLDMTPPSTASAGKADVP